MELSTCALFLPRLFYITGHQLSRADAEAALSSSRSLFRLPEEQKRLLPARTDGGFVRGFIGVGGESGHPTLYEAKVGCISPNP